MNEIDASGGASDEMFPLVASMLPTPDCPGELHWRQQETRRAAGQAPQWTASEAAHIPTCSWCRNRWAYAEAMSPPLAQPRVRARPALWPYALAASVVIAMLATIYAVWNRDGSRIPNPGYAQVRTELVNASVRPGAAVAKVVDPLDVVRDGQGFRLGFTLRTARKLAYVYRIDDQEATLLGRYPVAENQLAADLTGAVGDRAGRELFVVILVDSPSDAFDSLTGHLPGKVFADLQSASTADRGVAILELIHDALTTSEPRFWTGRADDIVVLGTLIHKPLP